MTATILRALSATWPPAATQVIGPVTLRAGQGAGRRASAATAAALPDPATLTAAEDAMRALGQVPLWQVTPGPLDDILAARGYAIDDHVDVMAGPVADIARDPPAPATVMESWPPLAAQDALWQAGGIGPARRAVMARAPGPKCTILGRHGDRPAGTAFVAMAEGVAVLHALVVAERFRRQGVARMILRDAALWAAEQGAETLALAVTGTNAGAIALYASLGMERVAKYHYRIRPD